MDEKVLENCWYYSALKFALYMSHKLRDGRYIDFLQGRKELLERNFEKVF